MPLLSVLRQLPLRNSGNETVFQDFCNRRLKFLSSRIQAVHCADQQKTCPESSKCPQNSPAFSGRPQQQIASDQRNQWKNEN